MVKRIKVLILYIIILFLTVSAQAQKIEIVSKSFLILPEDSEVRLKWIIIPSNEKFTNEKLHNNMQFCIDSRNQPIIAYDGKILMNPITGSLITIKKPFKKMVCSEDGAILFFDNVNLYYAEVDVSSKGALPEASLKTIYEFPNKFTDIYIGDKALFGLAYNESDKSYEVLLLNIKSKSFQKIATFSEKISALAGDKRTVFIASGRKIWQYSDGKLLFYFEHPREDIEELIFSQKKSLFYKTAHGIGYIKDGHAIEFLQTEDPKVFLKGTSLFVFFTKTFGLIELTHIDDLKKYNFRIGKIIDVKKNF